MGSFSAHVSNAVSRKIYKCYSYCCRQTARQGPWCFLFLKSFFNLWTTLLLFLLCLYPRSFPAKSSIYFVCGTTDHGHIFFLPETEQGIWSWTKSSKTWWRVKFISRRSKKRAGTFIAEQTSSINTGWLFSLPQSILSINN